MRDTLKQSWYFKRSVNLFLTGSLKNKGEAGKNEANINIKYMTFLRNGNREIM